MVKEKVSIIVPCYNQADFLDECLQSVLDQTYENWECIVVNDGSQDNSSEICKKWIEKDSRIKYFEKSNEGVSIARNFGIGLSSGEWILPLDADDKISNDYLELASKFFQDDYCLIYCRAKLFGAQDGEWILNDFSLYELAVANMIFVSAFFKRIDFNKTSGFDKNLIHGYEDWDFWITLLKGNPKVVKINKICFFYRIKQKSRSTELKSSNKNTLETLNYIHLKHFNFFINNLGNIQDLAYDSKDLKNLKNNRTFKLIFKIIKIKNNLLGKR